MKFHFLYSQVARLPRNSVTMRLASNLIEVPSSTFNSLISLGLNPAMKSASILMIISLKNFDHERYKDMYHVNAEEIALGDKKMLNFVVLFKTSLLQSVEGF